MEPQDPTEEQWLEIPLWRVPLSPPRLGSARARLWSLVLESRGIASRVEPGEPEYRLLVAPEQMEAACQELALFEAENRSWPPAAPREHPLTENTLSTLSLLLLLAIFHNLIQLDIQLPGLHLPDWAEAGSAAALRIREGEWWRLVTALTLHKDWLHLASNLAVGGMLVIFLCRELGSGLAWSLLLTAGALGNLANAWLQPASHTSLGASTAVFGAVGILAGLTLLRHRHQLRQRWLRPVAGALALLAVLGSEGKNTDLGAHLFGLLFGCLLGVGIEPLLARYGIPGARLNTLLACGSAALVLTAWYLAMTGKAG